MSISFFRDSFLILLLSVASAVAQDTSTLSYHQKIDVIYGEVHGTGLLMDVFVPKAKTNGLAVIDVVSGAFFSDRGKIREHIMGRIFQIFCARGYTVFAVRPGSRTRYTGFEMAANVKTSIRYVKQHAADYHIDPERIGITGASAGGHLATLVSVTPDEAKSEATSAMRFGTQVKAAAVFFPPTDFMDWDGKPANLEIIGDLLFSGGTKNHSEEILKEKAEQLSPARQVKGTPVPFLIIHGDADPIVPLQQSQKMVEVLKKAGGSAELIIKKGGGHPWMTIFEEVKLMADWFDQHLPETAATGSQSPEQK
jgi:acetyl esterase/lipase